MAVVIYISFGIGGVDLLVDTNSIIWGDYESNGGGVVVTMLFHELVNCRKRNYVVFVARKKIFLRVNDGLMWLLEYLRVSEPFAGEGLKDFSGENSIGIMVYFATGMDNSHENVLGINGGYE